MASGSLQALCLLIIHKKVSTVCGSWTDESDIKLLNELEPRNVQLQEFDSQTPMKPLTKGKSQPDRNRLSAKMLCKKANASKSASMLWLNPLPNVKLCSLSSSSPCLHPLPIAHLKHLDDDVQEEQKPKGLTSNIYIYK